MTGKIDRSLLLGESFDSFLQQSEVQQQGIHMKGRCW
jgi:hypothetical protein